jgi:FkbM family methyltransferase
MRQDSYYLNKWFLDRGDYTHNLNYELDENSIIIDLGGYKGLWVEEILKKMNPIIPNILLVEPVPQFYNHLCVKFNEIKKIKSINVGVSINDEEENKKIFISNDGSSTRFKNEGPAIEIKTVPISKILKDNNIENVDLIQINIEGDEYDLLSHMIETEIIEKFKNIQIQFHLGIDEAENKRLNIQKKLINLGFINKFEYPFVWESWTKK